MDVEANAIIQVRDDHRDDQVIGPECSSDWCGGKEANVDMLWKQNSVCWQLDMAQGRKEKSGHLS